MCEAQWPPRGYIFTTRAPSLIGRMILLGQRLCGWFPDGAGQEAAHAGVVDTFPFVWEAHSLRGVIRRRIGRRARLRFWHPPREAVLESEDFQRAFGVLRAHRGRRYDWRWIVTLGRFQRTERDICTELVKTYLDALTARAGGWSGMGIRRFVPNHVAHMLHEVCRGRGAQ